MATVEKEVEMKKPFLIIIDGPMGAGKSTTTLALHKKLRSTVILPLDRFKRFLSDYKNDSVKHLSFASDIGRTMAKECLKNNINVIVEKAFTEEKFVVKFINGMDKYARVFVYQLNAPLELRIKRIKQRPLAPESKKRPTLKKIKTNNDNFKEFRYKKARIFDTNNMSIKKIVNEIIKEIK